MYLYGETVVSKAQVEILGKPKVLRVETTGIKEQINLFLSAIVEGIKSVVTAETSSTVNVWLLAEAMACVVVSKNYKELTVLVAYF